MADKKPTRAVIVSDQAIYLRGLRSLVLTIPEIELVGEAGNDVEALQLCQMTEPELALLDLGRSHNHGFEIARHIYRHWPSTRVVLFLEPREDSQLQEDDELLPLCYFSRDVSEDEFKAAVTQILKDAHSYGKNPAGEIKGYWHHSSVEDGEGAFPAAMGVVGDAGYSRNQELLTRELVMAGKIQADILPEEPPSIPGWEIAATLEPARETSGDFYDFIPLTDRKWGVVVADVTDKGMGAALFMALSSTLIRTYATRFPTLPGLTLRTVSERILSDTRGGMFVTSFFGVLEPYTGRMVYANAGHPPGYLIRTHHAREPIECLRPTGMALGVSEQASWRQKIIRFFPGDYLILFTDGITEAQNCGQDFFGEDNLLDVALSMAGHSAQEIKDALLKKVHQFVGASGRQDDIALIVIRRNPED